MKRAAKYLAGLVALTILFAGGYLMMNVPLRTAVYRSVFKQPVYLISENDTVYGFGYFGVNKYLLKRDGDLELLCNNDDFCHNCFIGHLIGRSGVIYGNYIYVAARSYLGGRYKSSDKNYKKGMLLIMRKSDLSIIKQIEVDYSMIEAKIYNQLLVVSGLQGFNIYNIADTLSPKITYSYRTEKPYEFQGCEFIPKGDSLYVAFARFSDGLSIYNVTNSHSIKQIAQINIQDTLADGGVLPLGLQSFRIKYQAPYLYATLGPSSGYINTMNDYRGILVYDLSNIHNIKKTFFQIPKSDYYKCKKLGDPHPSHLDIYQKKLYTNFGEKGVAIFDIDNDTMLRYISTKQIPNIDISLPIHITNNGVLLVGDYNREKISSYNLNNNN